GRIAVGIDLRDGRVAIDGWLREAATGADDVAARADAAGAAAIVLTDIRRDGTGAGANLDATMDFAARHPTPVIVSGGVGSVDDVRRGRAAYERGATLAGVIVGRALYEGRVRLAEAVAAAAGQA